VQNEPLFLNQSQNLDQPMNGCRDWRDHGDAEHRCEGGGGISERPSADNHGLGFVEFDASGDCLPQGFN
jgi:hypothetical protein